ncbi:MAG TPA: DUF2076 family protein [Hyphomicrobiaceae bacterium]|nr:DUF2076 family protein [Hyphomicrobiaceae bacterium]
MALTPEERHAINDLFERISANGPADKDGEAEALINQLMRRTPDSAYILVQTTLVQEAHIEDLEARIRELEAQLAGNSRPPSRGGFLGGARRSAAPRDDYVEDRGYSEDRRSGIPPIGSRSGPSAYEPAPQPAWRGTRDEPANARPNAPPQPQSGGGGGFFRTAAAMAAGVAGGTLLANSLGGMFGGGKSGDAHASQDASTAHDSGHQDAIDNDPGNYDSNYHDTGVEEGDWGAGMDDIDI